MRSSRPQICLAAGCRRQQLYTIIPRRQPFSSTTTLQRKHPLPQFAPSSTPDLAAHLALIRSQILVPGYINETQRKLIRKKKYATQLANDPVYASIGEEEVRLKHVDVLKDIPNQAWAFRRALDLLVEAEQQRNEELNEIVEHPEEVLVDEAEAKAGTEKVTGFGDAVEIPAVEEQEDKAVQHAMRKSNGADWINMLGVVEGYHQSKISKLPPALLALFVQRAMAAGQPGVVFRGLEQVERNGLSLAHDAVRFRVFEGLWRFARDSYWETEATATAYKYTRRVIGLMERSEHCGSRVISAHDPRTEPFGLGVLIELAARQVEAAPAGSDIDALKRELRQAVERMVSLLSQQKDVNLEAAEAGRPIKAGTTVSADIGRVAQLASAPTYPELIDATGTEVSRGWAQAALAQMWLPVADGLTRALKVLPTSTSRNQGLLSTELSQETVAAARPSINRVEKLLTQLGSSWQSIKETSSTDGKTVPQWIALEEPASRSASTVSAP